MKNPVKFGKYYLLERISVGGMAEVFKAKSFGEAGFERLVAVKRILPSIAEDQEFIAMFVNEAKLAVQLTHPNIAQIFELGKVGEAYFIALEYVGGKDMRAIFERARKRNETIPIPMACYMVMKLCEGLDYAHNKKDASGRSLELVHRDVSPQNILVSYDGDVKLIDFGIAKAASKSSKTQAGILKGKFGYMSPEQVRGLQVNRRSDIFAVGICLYELLTMERLFVGESDFSTLEKVRNVEIMPPSTYNRKIPEELEAYVLKALAKHPEDRYRTAMDLHDDLQSFMYTSGNFFARKDLSTYQSRLFGEEISKENGRDEEYRKFDFRRANDLEVFDGAGPAQPPMVQGRQAPPPPPPAASAPRAAAAAPPPPPLPPNASSSASAASARASKSTIMGVGGSAAAAAHGLASRPVPAAPAAPAASSGAAVARVAPVAAAPPPPPSPSVSGMQAVATAVAAPAQAQAMEMDWDEEELATQVYDKPPEGLFGPKSSMPPPPPPRANSAPAPAVKVPSSSIRASGGIPPVPHVSSVPSMPVVPPIPSSRLAAVPSMSAMPVVSLPPAPPSSSLQAVTAAAIGAPPSGPAVGAPMFAVPAVAAPAVSAPSPGAAFGGIPTAPGFGPGLRPLSVPPAGMPASANGSAVAGAMRGAPDWPANTPLALPAPRKRDSNQVVLLAFVGVIVVAALVVFALKMTRGEPAGGLAITTNVGGVVVLVDEQPQIGNGQSFTVTNLAPDRRHRVVVSKPGFRTFQQEVPITDGQIIPMQVVLDPEPTVATAAPVPVVQVAPTAQPLAATPTPEPVAAPTPAAAVAPAVPAAQVAPAAVAPAVAPTHAPAAHAPRTPRVEPIRVPRSPEAAPRVVASAPHTAPEAPAGGGGNGTLRISTRPAAQCSVNGQNFSTPHIVQLPAGNYRVTCHNEELNAHAMWSVTIHAGEATSELNHPLSDN